MARIFISYSRSDRLFLDTFLPLIRKVYGNNSLWYDDDIHGGADWWSIILNEIGDCELFVYLISNESLESPYCQAELREALRLNKQILPVIVRRLKPPYPGNAPDDLEPVLKKTQYVDLTDMRDTTGIANLYAAINRLLEQAIPSAPQTAQPTPQPPVPDKKKTPWWANIPEGPAIIIAAVIGLIGVIVAAIIGLNPDPTNGDLTPQPDPTEIVELPNATSQIQGAITLDHQNNWQSLDTDNTEEIRDFSLQVQVDSTNLSTDGWCGIGFRNDGDGWFYYLTFNGNNELYLDQTDPQKDEDERFESGYGDPNRTASGFPDVFELEILALSNNFRVSIEGNEVINYTDVENPSLVGGVYVAGPTGEDKGWCTFITPNLTPTQIGGGRGEIAFYSGEVGNEEIFVAKTSAIGETQRLLGGDGHRYLFPSYSPDGESITFISNRGGNNSMWIANADGTNPRPLGDSSRTEWGSMAWSKDAERIAFSRWINKELGYQLFVMNSDGTSEVQLTCGSEWAFLPTWSPDSSKIVFQFGTERPHQLAMFDVSQASNSCVSESDWIELTTRDCSSGQPHWGNDTNMIVYHSNCEGNEDTEIFVMDVNQPDNTAQITSNGSTDWDPEFSPDDSVIAVYRNNSIVLIDREGNPIINLQTDLGGSHLAWRP